MQRSSKSCTKPTVCCQIRPKKAKCNFKCLFWRPSRGQGRRHIICPLNVTNLWNQKFRSPSSSSTRQSRTARSISPCTHSWKKTSSMVSSSFTSRSTFWTTSKTGTRWETATTFFWRSKFPKTFTISTKKSFKNWCRKTKKCLKRNTRIYFQWSHSPKFIWGGHWTSRRGVCTECTLDSWSLKVSELCA